MTTTDDDRQAIEALMSNYCDLLDGGAVDDLVGLFCADGEVVAPRGSSAGHAALREFWRETVEVHPPSGGRHVVGNTVPFVRGDEAFVVSDFFFVNFAVNRVAMTGQYRDRLVRVDGQWRIRHRSVTLNPDLVA